MTTPGNEGSERDAMTATRLDWAGLPEATRLSFDQPLVVARSRSSALVVRFGLAGVAIVSAIVGWVLFGDTDPSLGELGDGGYWPGARTRACGRRLLNRRRRTTRISQGALARRRFVDLRTAGRACPAVYRALVGRNAEARGGFIGRSGFINDPLLLANSIATDLFIGLSLMVLPRQNLQFDILPDGDFRHDCRRFTLRAAPAPGCCGAVCESPADHVQPWGASLPSTSVYIVVQWILPGS